MKKCVLFILLLTNLTFYVNGQETKVRITFAKPELTETVRILKTLSSDAFGGRKPGQPGFEKAVVFIESELLKNGIQPFLSTYRDTFKISSAVTYNIVGEIKAKIKTDEYVMISAHLDHLGIKLHPQTADSIYNGANDNASGSTAVMQIAKALNGLGLNKNVLVVFFSGEEDGLLGSRHLAHRLKDAHVNLKYALNFEMIGKTFSDGADRVYLTGYHKSNLASLLNKKLHKDFVKYLPAEIEYELFMRSDNFPFFSIFHIPSHTISSFDFNNYAYYHELQDEFSQLDVENTNAIIVSSTEAIFKLLTSNEKVILTE